LVVADLPAEDFFAGAFFDVDFVAGAFLVDAFLAAVFFAVEVFPVAFLPVDLRAGAFLAEAFLAVVFRVVEAFLVATLERPARIPTGNGSIYARLTRSARTPPKMRGRMVTSIQPSRK